MNDTNHVWNKDAPIRTKKQLCGCHVTPEKIDLCDLGALFKSNAGEKYNFYVYQKGCACNTQVTEGAKNTFELHKKIYLTHLSTGWDWPRMMWGADRCL